MKDRIKHIILLPFTLLLLLCGICVSAENTQPADSINKQVDYRMLLDSAAQYSQKGKHEEATTYYDKGFNAYKEYYQNRLENISQEMAATYELEQKEQEYARLQQTLTLKKTQTLLFTILIIILIVAVILIFIAQRYRLHALQQKRRQKENETTLLKLEKEKKELEVQLNTLQAGKYQKELLAGTLLVEYKSKVLEDLRLFFDTHPPLNKYKPEIEKIMGEEEPAEPETENSEMDLKGIHPTFYARLQKQANNKLTPLDLKYCRMIYLRMSSKEMADILEVDPKTIRVTKYRLKQKLDLGKEDDLSLFIEEMG